MPNVKALIGTKLGMTQVFDDEGRAVPVTLVEAGPCVVTQIRTPERDGYAAVQLGYGEIKETRVNKPLKGHFARAGVSPTRRVVEIRTDDAGEYEVGSNVTVDIFQSGDWVDVIGTSKGKGFAGVMKRHNFGGLRDSHGTERKHRSAGSVGAGTTPGRVFPGKKGAGRMGNERVTVLSQQVFSSDADKNLLMIRGAVPGATGSLVMIRTAVKKGAKA